jgi:CubicO group peptidase (beta-lactamase class C family)
MLNWSEIEARVNEAMSTAIVPGLALAVIQAGEVVYSNGFGVTSDLPDAPPVTTETLFRIGSVTKSLTATLVMRLVEAGTLKLDTPVTEYIPWLRLHDPDAASKITLRMLLSQTAGLPTSLDYAGWREASGLEAYVRTVLPSLPLAAPPGAVYAYSNPGYNLAGYVAEAATRVPYTTLMQREVFDPLGMTRSTFDPLLAMTWPLSQSFLLNDDGKPYVKRPFVDNTGEYPCGFAISNVVDLAKIVQMQVHDGRAGSSPFLSADSIRAMRTPHAEQYTLDERTYGLGLRQRTYKNVTLVGHNGAISKYGAFMWWQPEGKAAVLMLTNRSANFWGPGDRIILSIIDGLLGLTQKETPRTPAKAELPLETYAGAYIGPNIGLAVLSVTEGRPSLTLNGTPLTMERVYGRLYNARKPKGSTVPVGFAGTADAPVLYVDGSACMRVSEPLSGCEPDVWAARQGIYSGETDRWHLRLEGDQLRIYSEDDRVELPALPIDDTRLASDFGLFEYVEGDTPMLIGGGGLWRFYRDEVRTP